MKTLSIVLLFGVLSGLPISSLGLSLLPEADCDLIILKDGDEIEAKVLEIDIKTIKYKRCNFVEGPTYTLKQSDIFMIKYSDGSKDVFTDNNPLKKLIPKGRKRTHRSADATTPDLSDAPETLRESRSSSNPKKEGTSDKPSKIKKQAEAASLEPASAGQSQQVQLNYKGGFFAKDVRMTLLWDGEAIGEGSFKNGFSLRFPSEPGTHKLVIDIGFRKYKYDIELSGSKPPDIQFKYDRMFGRLLIDKKKSSF